MPNAGDGWNPSEIRADNCGLSFCSLSKQSHLCTSVVLRIIIHPEGGRLSIIGSAVSIRVSKPGRGYLSVIDAGNYMAWELRAGEWYKPKLADLWSSGIQPIHVTES